MEQKEILRKEAIRLHLNRTRQWVYKWLKKQEESIIQNPGSDKIKGQHHHS
jgi:hypothetical protein